MSTELNRRFRLVMVCFLAAFLFGCGGKGIGSDDICSDAPIENLTVTVSDEMNHGNNLCLADVVAVKSTGESYPLFADEVENNQSCSFSVALHDQGTFDIEVRLEAYKTGTLDGIAIVGNNCNETNEDYRDILLQITPLSCAEGYSIQQGECKTTLGCVFPLQEEATISGVLTELGGLEDSMSCVDACTVAPSSLPGTCSDIIGEFCLDGYSYTEGQCQTTQGCVFPRLEEHWLNGARPPEREEDDPDYVRDWWSCRLECEFGLSETAARCEDVRTP